MSRGDATFETALYRMSLTFWVTACLGAILVIIGWRKSK